MENKIIDQIVKSALLEDVAGGDITTNILVSDEAHSYGFILLKEKQATLCGLEVARKVFARVDPQVEFESHFKDGQLVRSGDRIARLKGSTKSILTAERLALNFLSYMSAIATKTAAYVHEVKDFDVQILDTRKTTPGLRALERYAVRCGQGHNHRANLHDMILIKDNHRLARKPNETLAAMIRRVRAKTDKPVEIEVDTLDELRDALKGQPDMILLDNMTPADIAKAVKFVRAAKIKKRPLLEASGGINMTTVRKVAESGVDRISIGDLTHSRQAVDFSLELIR